MKRISLLFTSILLSGVLAWVNFKGTRWRMILEPHFRVGKITPVRIELSNDKRLLPTYSLWFNVHAQRSEESKRVYLQERLDARSSTQLDWIFEPKSRGREIIAIDGLETQFPFGFLRKIVGGGMRREVFVWPSRSEYEFHSPSGLHAVKQGETVLKPGWGTELINLREYQTGDPQRLVHWKASARVRRLMVRQMSEENQDAYVLFVESPTAVWRDAEQFEILCSFAASLAEDLYMEHSLWGTAINDEPLMPVKKLSDLHGFMEQLARLETVDRYTPMEEISDSTVITFAPGHEREVVANVGGSRAGAA